MTTSNHCGTCTACCRVFAIPELKKPAGKWCSDCAIGVGCKRYETRPEMCVDFKCLWLQSQERPEQLARLPLALRPDKCRVVFSPTTDSNIMSVTTMPGSPGAWERRDVRELIDTIIKAGINVVIGAPCSTDRIGIDKYGMRPVKMTPPDEQGMQWNIPQNGDA